LHCNLSKQGTIPRISEEEAVAIAKKAFHGALQMYSLGRNMEGLHMLLRFMLEMVQMFLLIQKMGKFLAYIT